MCAWVLISTLRANEHNLAMRAGLAPHFCAYLKLFFCGILSNPTRLIASNNAL
jgi:hypothetical protein